MMHLNSKQINQASKQKKWEINWNFKNEQNDNQLDIFGTLCWNISCSMFMFMFMFNVYVAFRGFKSTINNFL